MRFVRAVAAQVLGLFVGEWRQTLMSIAILAAGWFVLSRFHLGGLAFLVAIALAVQLVYATATEARRSHS